MSDHDMIERLERLRRLVRISELIYRQRSAELTVLHRQQAAVAQAAAAAASYLDRDSSEYDFLSELALAHAGRLRVEMKEIDARFSDQLEVTTAALAGYKGAESRYFQHNESSTRLNDAKALEDAIALAITRTRISLE